MKKLIYLLAITFGLALIGACGNAKTEQKEATDTTKKDVIVVDTAKKVTVDTSVKVVKDQKKK